MSSASKSVADPVHGTIQLDPLEIQIICTRAFQRLRNVKQLGLAHMVFPGADYSRFSHSVGVCHVTGRVLDALNARSPNTITRDERQLFRLAGLLHDVGHYPFSHATEVALKGHFADQLFKPSSGAPESGTIEPDGEGFVKHEKVGELILGEDEELRRVLRTAGVTPEDVSAIFTHRNVDQHLANLISSDLDVDRIDYLMRTARHTGLPYGAVDLEYLLTQFCVDKDKYLCVTPKALRAVEHFLLARYFDYQQVSYHKTVAGLELVLKDVIRLLLDQGLLKASKGDIKAQIADGTWGSIDDSHVLQLIRKLLTDSTNEIHRQKATSILERRPPKMVASAEHFGPKDKKKSAEWKKRVVKIKARFNVWAAEFGIPEDMWYVWDQTDLGLTKIGPQVAIEDAQKPVIEEQAGQVVRIYSTSGDGTSTPIFGVQQSLMSVLASQALYALRVYVLMPQGANQDQLRQRISARIRNDFDGSVDWK